MSATGAAEGGRAREESPPESRRSKQVRLFGGDSSRAQRPASQAAPRRAPHRPEPLAGSALCLRASVARQEFRCDC